MSHATQSVPEAAEPADAILRVEDVVKIYGSTIALAGVNLSVRRGSIHGLLGENGAGKSTLVGIISGQRQPTSGRVLLDGHQLTRIDVKSMEEAGVFLVTQEPMIVDHLSAAENLMLGIWPRGRFGFVDWRQLQRDTNRMLEGTGIPADARAGALDAVARRKLNILRAMFSGGKVIILDEPTAALTVKDRIQLFEFMRRLQRKGVTFIFISHYNDEILEVCDAVSVLRDGQLVGGSEDVSNMTSDELAEMVLGRGLVLFQRERKMFRSDNPAIELRTIHSSVLSVPAFDIRPGEVVGFTGLPGGGGKELARCLFGLHRTESGTIRFPGESAPRAFPSNPTEAFKMGIGFLSDDRRRDGSVSQMSIADNISLSSLDALSRHGFIDDVAEKTLAANYFTSLGIKASDSAAAVDTLSGGNQQKVCLGRVLATKPRLLILDEPTRGIDIGVKQDVLQIIDDLSHAGVAVIIVSTDTDELVRVTDRVCIFSDGRISETVAGHELTRGRLRNLG